MLISNLVLHKNVYTYYALHNLEWMTTFACVISSVPVETDLCNSTPETLMAARVFYVHFVHGLNYMFVRRWFMHFICSLEIGWIFEDELYIILEFFRKLTVILSYIVMKIVVRIHTNMFLCYLTVIFTIIKLKNSHNLIV